MNFGKPAGTRSLFGGFIVLPPTDKFVKERDEKLIDAVTRNKSAGSYYAQAYGFSGLKKMSEAIKQEEQ